MTTVRLTRLKGFTLIELMVTISIAGIMIGIAVPSFTSIITSTRLTTLSNELVTALNLARSEAVKRGQQVVVRKTGTNWENGWRIFVDIDRSTAAKTDVYDAASDIVLRVYPALPGSYTLRGDTNFTNFIRYTPMGAISNPTGGHFIICDSGDIAKAKMILVTGSGRVRMASDTNNNGIPEDDQNNDINSCT